eukprot:6196153-Pleurochrysis_carterae.AAC.2
MRRCARVIEWASMRYVRYARHRKTSSPRLRKPNRLGHCLESDIRRLVVLRLARSIVQFSLGHSTQVVGSLSLRKCLRTFQSAYSRGWQFAREACSSE